jgi:hypothetical protein
MSLRPILYELNPDPGVDSLLFQTNPGQTSTGTIFCINRSVDLDLINIALVKNGNLLNSECYLCYQTLAYFGQSIYLQQIYLGSEDSIVVTSQNGTTTFTFTGYDFG